jgi:kynurenine formamidase
MTAGGASEGSVDAGLVDRLRRLVRTGRVFELSHDLAPGMPMHPYHHAYSLVPHRRHGDTERPGGATFANEVITTPGHAGTHIDALGHFSRHGTMHGGCLVSDVATHEGLRSLDITTTPPILRRGVLLDVAAIRGVQCLEPGEPVEGADLEACAGARNFEVEAGDVVLVRTGWERHWQDPASFTGGLGGCPGVAASGADWLIAHGAGFAGTDTAGFEVAPPRGVSVHAMLLVDAGIQIIENLALDQLAGSGVAEFLFVALPLRLAGATGSPIRAIAVT